MAALGAVANVVGIASGIAGIASAFGGLFAPDYTQFFEKMIEQLDQLIAGQQQIIGLLAYISAILLATISNTAVYQSTEALQSNVDYYSMLSHAQWPAPYSAEFNEQIMLKDGMLYDLDVIHHGRQH